MLSIVRHYPFLDDPFFNNFFNIDDWRSMPWHTMKNEDDHVDLSLDLPGVKKEDISLILDRGKLTLEAQRDKKKFTKIVTLPYDAHGPPTAKLRDGVLTISIPKVSPDVVKIAIE
jgi:HSP20 family molecular chaperone IbpA